MAIVQRGPTLEEFLVLPETKPAREYVDGKVARKVAPKARHSALQAEFLQQFNGYSLPRRLARAFPELRITCGGQSRVPDVCVFRWERIERDPTGQLVDDVQTPP